MYRNILDHFQKRHGLQINEAWRHGDGVIATIQSNCFNAMEIEYKYIPN